jgi:hypothetical protein
MFEWKIKGLPRNDVTVTHVMFVKGIASLNYSPTQDVVFVAMLVGLNPSKH